MAAGARDAGRQLRPAGARAGNRQRGAIACAKQGSFPAAAKGLCWRGPCADCGPLGGGDAADRRRQARRGRLRLGAVRSGLLARRTAAATGQNQSIGCGGSPIFNDLNFGGFLIYHQPRLRVFVDDRCSLYGSEFLQAYEHARREAPAEIERWRRQYGFRYALVESDGQFDRYLSSHPAWTQLGRTPAAALYGRDIGLPAAIR